MKTSKQLVADYMQEVWVEKNVAALPAYIHPDHFIQHNPNLDNGLKALQDFLPYLFDTLIPGASWEVKRIIAEADLVAVHSLLRLQEGPSSAVVDLFRIEEGKIVEHWDVAHEIPATSKNGNPVV